MTFCWINISEVVTEQNRARCFFLENGRDGESSCSYTCVRLNCILFGGAHIAKVLKRLNSWFKWFPQEESQFNSWLRWFFRGHGSIQLMTQAKNIGLWIDGWLNSCLYTWSGLVLLFSLKGPFQSWIHSDGGILNSNNVSFGSRHRRLSREMNQFNLRS